MRIIAPLVSVALLLSACSASSENAGAKSGTTSSSSSSSGSEAAVTVGPATVSGAVGQSPTVSIDTTAAPAAELLVHDIVTGNGDTVAAGATVTAHYAGYGAMTGQKFDASFDRGEPATFPLDQVILGWQQGLVGMKVGGRRVLVIPAALAYGDTPPTAAIKPGETLVFVVDLVSIG